MTSWERIVRFGGRLTLAILSGSLVIGCANLNQHAGSDAGPSLASFPAVAHAGSESQALEKELVSLAPTVNRDEASRVATSAYAHSNQLALDYHVVRPALFHNFLVNIGVKQRGLCYQWAEDLLAQLQTLGLVTLELRWGMARSGTCREHNCIVVTARGQPFDQGIVLDAWRHSGHLVWAYVSSDRYPWKEGELAPAPAPPNSTAPAAR